MPKHIKIEVEPGGKAIRFVLQKQSVEGAPAAVRTVGARVS
jgi:hypothetical protein